MKIRSKNKSFVIALAAAGTAYGVAAPAFAQIEEVVVTTRKREENLQEVPIVITAFTAETIARKGIADLKDITKYTTGLILDEGYSKQDTRVVIRGLSPTRGRQNVAFLLDEVDISSLAIGTAGGTALINPRLLDIERVEVVKGPHSALFGRSAFNGAINYITKKPDETFRGTVGVDVGTYGKVEGRAGISGPVVEDKLFVGINGAGWNQDGFYKSPITGKSLGGTDGAGGSFSTVFTPNDVLKFTGRVEYSKDNFEPQARVRVVPNAVRPIPAAAQAVNGGVTSITVPTFQLVAGSLGHASDYTLLGPSTDPRTGTDFPGSDREMLRANLRADATFTNVTFTSISGYGYATTHDLSDALYAGDYASPSVNGALLASFIDDTRQLSQEFRLQSNDTGPFQWTVGGLYWNEVVRHDSESPVCLSSSGGCAAVIKNIGSQIFAVPNILTRNTYHYSAYALASYEITSQFGIEVEGRQTWELEKNYGASTGGSVIIGCSTRALVNGSVVCSNAVRATTPIALGDFLGVGVKSKFFTPRVTLNYKPTDHALVYASVSEGKKPGGLSTVSASLVNFAAATRDNYIYQPEKMWVYELGAKTTWLDGRLLLNGSAYYQDFSQKQVSVANLLTSGPNAGLIGTRVTNASSARVYGFELESSLAVTKQWSVTFGYNYLDAKYADFTVLTQSPLDVARAGNCTIEQGRTTATAALTNFCRVNYSGKYLEGAPKHSFQASSQYRDALTSDVDWFVEGDVRHQTRRYTTFDNSVSMDPYWNVDLRGGLATAKWTITAYVNNLFDDDTLKASGIVQQDWNLSLITGLNSSAVSSFVGTLPDKRQFGVRASYNF